MKGGIAWYTSPLDTSGLARLFSTLSGDEITLLNPATNHTTFLSAESE